MRPLEGLTVLDFTTLLPGPLATLMLAEAGAQVVKIERPGGEDMRAAPPLRNGRSTSYALLNAGKSSLVLDLKRESDRAKLEPWLARADILVEQFRPGVMARLGLDAPTLRKRHPRLIYCSISGYGQAGPRAGEAGHDLNYIAASGLLGLAPGPAGSPVVPPALVADIAGGSFPAVINILLALRQRDLTGEGCHIDIAMADVGFTFAWQAMAQILATGRGPGPAELQLAGGSPRYALYPTSDGRIVACAALEPKFWAAFCTAIGLEPALADDTRDPAATRAGVAAIVARETADHWRPILAAADCCVTIVATLDEALADPHFRARGLFARQIADVDGHVSAALPLPVSPLFRQAPDQPRAVRDIGADDPVIVASLERDALGGRNPEA